MEMVEFLLSDDKKSIQVNIDPNTGGRYKCLTIECHGDPIYASLLYRRLTERFDNMVRGIREEEYLLGYKHGRAKVGKKSWFSTMFQTGKSQ
jgi:hypothetical protein